MKCKISCSFGEVVDKWTILNIKKNKATNNIALSNIINELNAIGEDNTQVNNNDVLFTNLYEINKKLWEYEDIIRDKSRLHQFNNEYIKYAELIHKTNDERYLIKKQINEKYNSELKEEKIYTYLENNLDKKDVRKLEIGKKLYTDGFYNESMTCITKLMNKYKEYTIYNSFYIDLLFSYNNICSMFNITNKYSNVLEDIMSKIDGIEITEEQKHFCKSIYTTTCLLNKMYSKSYTYISNINYIKGPNISYKNMSFFRDNDRNKTLLLYDGGGLGDTFMLSRFIPRLCQHYEHNNVVCLVSDTLVWFFTNIFKSLSNIKIVSFKQTHLISVFDYHCSFLSLLKYLHIEYETLYMDSIYSNISPSSDTAKNIINTLNKPTYILNWKGNPDNPHEKKNRMMDLVNAIPLFKLSSIQWIVIQKNITQQEKRLLKRYNIKCYGNILDKKDAFYDTIVLLKNIEGVVSTDTSLPHLSLSLNVKTYVLLTIGCEWRWTRGKTTNWYPDAILLRQKELSNWTDPIDELRLLLTDI